MQRSAGWCFIRRARRGQGAVRKHFNCRVDRRVHFADLVQMGLHQFQRRDLTLPDQARLLGCRKGKELHWANGST